MERRIGVGERRWKKGSATVLRCKGARVEVLSIGPGINISGDGRLDSEREYLATS